jgi:hypothetical protein
MAVKVSRVSPFRPATRGGRALDPALTPGPRYLQDLFRRFLARCDEQERADLRCWLRDRDSLAFATVCSGSESPVLVWRAFAETMEEELGVAVTVSHKYACERCDRKQAFIRTMFPETPLLFCDATTLAGGQAYEATTCRPQRVPEADLVFGGFPCTDASRLNRNGPTLQNRSCISPGSLRTGAVFGGIHKLAATPGRVRMALLLENVTALGDAPKGVAGRTTPPDNLSMAVHLLGEEGGSDMVVVPLELCPRLFGVPQSRARLWIPAFARRCCRGLYASDGEVAARVHTLASMLVGSEMMPLDSFLLSEQDPCVVTARRHAEARALVRQGDLAGAGAGLHGQQPAPDTAPLGKRQRSDLWPVRHVTAFCKAGLSWAGAPWPDSDTLQCFPGLHALSLRELDILKFHGLTFPEAAARTMDVSQGLGRGHPPRCGLVPCLTPGGRVYLSHRCRLLLGQEALRLQGLFYPSPERLNIFEDKFLRDLAGNAFEASCCAAALFIVCVVLSRGASAGHRGEPGDRVPGGQELVQVSGRQGCGE